MFIFATYTETTSSSVGEEAVFVCRNPTADLIDWFVNGSLVGRNPPPGVLPGIVQTDNGTIVNTLTIVGRPEYNGTVVVCEAFFRAGSRSELSPEAYLQGYLASTVLIYALMCNGPPPLE